MLHLHNDIYMKPSQIFNLIIRPVHLEFDILTMCLKSCIHKHNHMYIDKAELTIIILAFVHLQNFNL